MRRRAQLRRERLLVHDCSRIHEHRARSARSTKGDASFLSPAVLPTGYSSAHFALTRAARPRAQARPCIDHLDGAPTISLVNAGAGPSAAAAAQRRAGAPASSSDRSFSAPLRAAASDAAADAPSGCRRPSPRRRRTARPLTARGSLVAARSRAASSGAPRATVAAAAVRSARARISRGTEGDSTRRPSSAASTWATSPSSPPRPSARRRRVCRAASAAADGAVRARSMSSSSIALMMIGRATERRSGPSRRCGVRMGSPAPVSATRTSLRPPTALDGARGASADCGFPADGGFPRISAPLASAVTAAMGRFLRAAFSSRAAPGG